MKREKARGGEEDPGDQDLGPEARLTDQVARFMEEDCELIERERRMPLTHGDSPIEDIFLWEFRQVAGDEVIIKPQYEVETDLGRKRLDFLLLVGEDGPRVGVECDGKRFHEATQDALRDAAIVATGAAERIYRLRGRDICFRMHEALQMLSLCEPRLFSERGKINLKALCRGNHALETYEGLGRMALG